MNYRSNRHMFSNVALSMTSFLKYRKLVSSLSGELRLRTD
jgi:hypothetical protein